MGSIEVRNPLLSKKFKRTETRLLIIDDNQIRYNQIIEIFAQQDHLVQAVLLDDLKSFEKQLHLDWDLIIFGRAYDLKVEQALSIVQASTQPSLPVLLIKPDQYEPAQYNHYIYKGVYDVINLDFPERFYIGLVRALSYYRLVQAQQRLSIELEMAQNQAQTLVQESHKAVAIIQEGIHIQANNEYLNLFGLEKEDEVIGLPLLDILQPEDLNDFKQRFKKISQGQFDQGHFEIRTLNSQVACSSALELEFVSAAEEDALQIRINCDSSNSNTMLSNNSSPQISEKNSSSVNPFQLVNRYLISQPAKFNALVVFSLATCSDQIFKSDWNTLKTYFLNIEDFIREQTHTLVFKVHTILYGALFQAESEEILESQLMSLRALEKAQLLTVNDVNFSLQLQIGYTLIPDEIRDNDHFEELLEYAFNHHLPELKHEPELELTAPLEVEPAPVPEVPETALSAATSTPSLVQVLAQKLQQADIHLRYQQLYDKQDINLYTYEVTSGIIYENRWQEFSGLADLQGNHELSIKLDRWVLVEACKQLHNFIRQYPDARLIVNLNQHILFNDSQLPELVAKLITIIGSKQSHPLILQFAEEEILYNLPAAQKQIALLRQYGAEISIRNFGNSIYSESLLNQIELQYVTLDQQLTQLISNDKELGNLQEKIINFLAIKPVEIILRELDDMNLFANAWNIEARYLEGNYFQKKLEFLTDVQDQ
ncbi:EAL domain-containing protein [Acinetobacter radioresistens]|uniref:EAL domain-containing protein n=1 Tax=Acinetobacter radioresistens TaxID=40216 RepID=UPI003B27DC87